MSEDAPYRRLENYYGTVLCCGKRANTDGDKLDLQECVRQLEKLAKTVRVRGKNLHFCMNKNTIDAKASLRVNDRAYATMLLQKNQQLKQTREQCIALEGKLELLRHQIENAAGMQAVKRSMKGSKLVLDTLLGELDVESLDELMDGLVDQMSHLGEVGEALGRELEYTDVSAELVQLGEEVASEAELMMPEVPHNNNNIQNTPSISSKGKAELV